MQERLSQMGEWLKINGEAIYGTRRWKHVDQWSSGDRNWKYNGKYYVSGNAILKQTVDPDPGYAVQEVFFTSKGDNIYAILPKYLKSIVLKDIYSTSQTKISLLGCDKEVEWKQEKDNIRITMPFLSFEELSCNYAWTLKLEKVK